MDPRLRTTLAPVLIDIDGARIASHRLGPDPEDSCGDIVICHGTPWSSRMWWPLAQSLSDRYRVFMWDMPGYGSSIAEADHTTDLISQRRRLTALIGHWGLERPHVIAHDIGGAVALGSHLLEGGVDFGSLYLLDIVTLQPWGSPFFRLVAQNAEVFAGLPANLHRALVTEYISGAGTDLLSPEWVHELARPWCEPNGQRAFYRQIAQLKPEHTEPIVEELGRVRCPVRIGWGERDRWIPRSQATELARRLPGSAPITEFSGAGHLVPLERADRFRTEILNWLRDGTLPQTPRRVDS